MVNWGNFFAWNTVISTIDIIVVWFLIYKLMMVLRGTKAVQLFKGVIVIIIVKIGRAHV